MTSGNFDEPAKAPGNLPGAGDEAPDVAGEGDAPSRRTWNYRGMSFKQGEEAWQAIHEVHYRDGVPIAYSREPAVVMWDAEEGIEGGLWCLERMREALSKPVLTEGDFPQPQGSAV